MLLERKVFTAPARLWMNWPLWGSVLATMLLAQHAWVLFAPAERALPGNTSIPASNRTGQLFGTASVGSAPSASLDGIRPVGIFAHSTRGFAVMQTPSGQRGVGLGSEVAPGIRLVETHADHVILERNGIRQRVDLSAPSAADGISSPAPAVVQQAEDSRITANAPLLDRLSPEQQTMMKQMLQNNHRGLP
ncbi:MAG: type II secretion system protein N [Sideroxydans sp.]|nr:type II secretion system protein N [Sideroxydans sp.]